MPLKNTLLLITQSLTFTPDNPPRPHGRYTFQRVRPGLGNVPSRPSLDLQLRRHVVPLDPKTPAQIARRDLMRAAVARWRASTSQDKAEWKIIAQNRSISVFNAAISDTLNNYHLDGGLLVKN